MVTKCLGCNKMLTIKPGQIKINSKRKFCDDGCRTRYNARKDFNKKRNNQEYKDKAKQRFHEWYLKNKDRQKKNVLSWYHSNKERWNARRIERMKEVKDEAIKNRNKS